MRAQLRTYHSIPSLQAHQDPNAYKQLQDAPRLKSILKGATEDNEQPSTLEDIRNAPIPRTNPVNLIFVLSQFAPQISEMHFDVPRDFFDLVMKSGLGSRSRATAFLWLMWWYLESDFSEHDALNNPFGPGRRSKEGDTSEMPIKTPQFDILTDEQATLENVDTEEEKSFGEVKRQERIQILASDALAPVVTGPKRGVKRSGFTNNPVFSVMSDDGAASPAPGEGQSPAPSVAGSIPASSRSRQRPTFIKSEENPSDSDRTRSASPLAHSGGLAPKSTPGMSIDRMLNNRDERPPGPTQATPTPAAAAAPQPIKLGRGNWSKAKRDAAAAAYAAAVKERQAQGLDPMPPAVHTPSAPAGPSASSNSGPHGFYLPLNGQEPAHKRSRPLTTHQLAVEKFRKDQVNYRLGRKLIRHHKAAQPRRKREGAFLRAWRQIRTLPDAFDSEEELQVSLMQRHEDLPLRTPFRGLAGVRLADPVSQSLMVDARRDDCGEEVHAYKQAFSRAGRRLERWEQGLAVVRKPKKLKGGGAVAETVEERDAGEEGDVEAEDEDEEVMMADRSSLPPEDDADDDDMDGGGMDEDEDEDELMGDG